MRTNLLTLLIFLGSQVKADGHLYPSDILSNGNILYSEVVGLDINIHTNVIVLYEDQVYKCRRRYGELSCDKIKEIAIRIE